MGFFDLNIPYEASQSSKATRMKLVIKAMEFGYSGVAYNRTMKGVMSEHDRCSIPFLSFSSLLNVVPSLASSVTFHRELLGVPRNTPFRQYTRLTICVDSTAQAQVLNSGNPILKSYDVVAVKPANQIVFDHACLKSEVDIIAIDFSEKLPFRLKMSMVKAAVERGVYFEITYSDLIADAQARKQMIPNAKLLVDWTRGKNLIFSCAASSVTEIRGPYDVANLLSSLLGLSMERAKAAISKNCRNLLTNSLRKKNFYKEAIRVEPLSSGQASDSKNALMDWLKWDPISSGDGDLQLDDVAKSFSTTAKVSKTINFDSIVDGVPSLGGSFRLALKPVESPPSTIEVVEKLDGDELNPLKSKISVDHAPYEKQLSGFGDSDKFRLPDDNATSIPCLDEIRSPTTTNRGEPMILDVSEDSLYVSETEEHNLSSQHISLSVSNPQEDRMVSHTLVSHSESISVCTVEAKMDVSENADFIPEIDKNLPSLDNELNAPVDEDEEVILEPQNHAQACTDASGNEPLQSENISVLDADKVSLPVSSGVMAMDAPTVNYRSIEDIKTEELVQKEGNADTILPLDDNFDVIDGSSDACPVDLKEQSSEEECHAGSNSSNDTTVPSFPGKSRAKPKRTPMLLPFKRLLNPMAFKKKGKRSRNWALE
ncbi:Protein GAMETOPHYTE DEFECTIVE 1 [Linum perenne]